MHWVLLHLGQAICVHDVGLKFSVQCGGCMLKVHSNSVNTVITIHSSLPVLSVCSLKSLTVLFIDNWLHCCFLFKDNVWMYHNYEWVKLKGVCWCCATYYAVWLFCDLFLCYCYFNLYTVQTDIEVYLNQMGWIMYSVWVYPVS